MPFNIDTFTTSLKQAFKDIEKSQAESLSKELASNFLAGMTAGEKHRSTLPAKSIPAGILPAVHSEDPEEDLSDEDNEELALLLALFLGNLKSFNTAAQDQILSTVKEMSEAGQTQDEIQKYVTDVFEGREPIVVDNTGKKKKELYVDKDLKISERDKIISKPFFASILTYATMLAENAAHRAYETGRKSQYRKDGFEKWMFVGPADERARIHHIALLGEVYTWGTEQSNYAEKVLREPRCRHRAQVYSDKDSDPAYWKKLKDDSGLFWNETESKWDMRD